ncbi:MAG: hypothetical protein H7A31_02435 [Thermotogae bacterium]|nr:hypothetical protein [Thermotogota bacterium]HOO75928.1 hypothetical protein [Tepiditoga sp.]
MKKNFLLFFIFFISAIGLGKSYYGISYIPRENIGIPTAFADEFSLKNGVLFCGGGGTVKISNIFIGGDNFSGKVLTDNGKYKFSIEKISAIVGTSLNFFGRISFDTGISFGEITHKITASVNGTNTINDFLNGDSSYGNTIKKEYSFIGANASVNIYPQKFLGVYVNFSYNIGYSQNGWVFEINPEIHVINDNTDKYTVFYEISSGITFDF